MKQKKRWIACLAILVLLVQSVPAVTAISEIPFTDVTTADWFYKDVCNAYNMGLINGRSETSFAPQENMTYAEAIKLAACMYQVYTKDAPFVVNCTPWYEIYMHYCYEKGIINREYPWDSPITRAAYIDIFSRALPEEALAEINRVDDGMIPDVAMTHRYARSIYAMYRAGIVQGQDNTYSFAPDSYVKRSEVAAILSRMMDISQRVSIVLIQPSQIPQIPEDTTPTTPPSGGNTTPNYPYYPIYPPTDGGSGNTESDSPSADDTTSPPLQEEIPSVIYPWENGGKQPKDYTWAEYEALTDSQKEAFCESFGSTAAFVAWMNAAQGKTDADDLPWENGGKQPKDYTWAEYEVLTSAQQEAFFESFGDPDAFAAWMDAAQGKENIGELPWENGGKQPKDYTWAEYEALTNSQKEAFCESFGDTAAFVAWMDAARGKTDAGNLPWENGGKQPKDYTWAEYEALTSAQQEAFFESFGDPDAFAAWMDAAQGKENAGELPWENGGKQPKDYTWAEYEALTNSQKEAFCESFGDTAAFVAWMDAAQGKTDAGNLPWENGGKQPKDYTWAEYIALTPAQQEAFFESFGDPSAFAAWMDANR